MAAARGDYIAFLDSDDVYLPTRIERHLATFRDADHADIVVSGEIYWWSWNSRTPADVCEPADLPFVPSVSPGIVFRPTELLVILLELAGAATPSICSITFRRRLFADFGGVPERFAGLYEDQALIAKLLLHGRAVVLDECLAKYRQHPDSLTYAAIRRGEYRPGRPHLAERLYLDWLGEAAADQAVLTPRLARALGRLRWPYDHPIAARLHLALRELGRASRRSLRMLAEVILPPKPMAGINARLAARRRRRAACHAGDVEQSVLGERRNG